MTFGRAITKITLNYVAHEYGTKTALMAQFNEAFSWRTGKLTLGRHRL